MKRAILAALILAVLASCSDRTDKADYTSAAAGNSNVIGGLSAVAPAAAPAALRAPREAQSSDQAHMRPLAEARAPAVPSDSLAKPLAGKIDAIAQKKTEKNQFLTYEHFITLETGAEQLPMLYDKLAGLCKADEGNACVILNSSLSAGSAPYAQLRIRAKAEGINAVARAAAQGAKVLGQETRVEDLSGPIADAGRRLEMLNLYQKKLMELDRKAGYDLDTQIRITNVIASVQADIEQITGEKARLGKRTATDILNITLNSTPPQHLTRSYWAPISDALQGIVTALPYNIAAIVAALPFLLLWGVILSLVYIVAKKLRQRRPKWFPVSGNQVASDRVSDAADTRQS